MSDEAINPNQPITAEVTRAQARRDFAANKPRDARGLHWASKARAIYEREYDRLANEARIAANLRSAQHVER